MERIGGTTVDIAELTVCEVDESGRLIRLGARDRAGAPVTITLSLDQAESIMMTLPHLLKKALHARTNDPHYRIVFPLGRWTVEQVEGHACLIMTLGTADGFEVSFGAPPDMSRALAAVLKQAALAVDSRIGADAWRASCGALN